jgi:hypothetical protein
MASPVPVPPCGVERAKINPQKSIRAEGPGQVFYICCSAARIRLIVE